MKLTTKLTLLFPLLSILPIVIVGWLAYHNSRETITQQTANHLIATNLYKKSEFSRWVQDNALTLEILAQDPQLKNSLAAASASGVALSEAVPPELRHMIEAHMLPVIAGGGFIELFALKADDGRVLISTDKANEGKYLENRPFFLQGKHRTFIQNVYYSMALQRPAMTISAPVRDETGHLVAVLAGHLNLADLSKIMEKPEHLSRSEDTYLINRFYFFITEPRFGKDYALKKSVHTEGVDAALDRREGVRFYNDYRGVPVIGAYHWLPEWELGLITEVDQAEAFEPIHALEKAIGGIGAAVALAATLAGLFIALSITRPLLRLVVETEKIGRGNLDYQVGHFGQDEIGELDRSFGRMVAQLKETLISRDELTAEVAVRKRTEKRLKSTLAALGRSNKELEQFAYVASHDLQEPLRMVASYTQLLAERYEEHLDEKAKKYIHYAVDGAVRMQRLIQDLLAFSKVAMRGGNFEKVDINRVFDNAVNNLEVSIREAHAVLTKENLPEVTADPLQLTQVLQNLIANAIKFCNADPPRVHVSVQQEDNGDWVFGVKDNGIGIASQYRDKIFVIFQRLHTREEYPGTGIGLALCKRIIERHGGRIWFESEPGLGSTFFFSVPIMQRET